MDKVSIIITTKNEGKNIRNCLESIKRQTYSNYEIIVVDNKSTDDTKDIAREYTKNVFDKGPERSAQRNHGVEKSKGKWILYLDADMILTPKVVEECVNRVMQNDKIIGLYIPEKIVGKSFWIKVRNFERSFYDGTVIDCARFISKSAFKKVHGFDLTMTGPEDWDLDKKLRYIGRIGLIKSHLLHNEGEFDMKKYLDKKSYYSKSMDTYVNKWGRNDRDVKKQLGAFYRLFGVFIEKGRIFKLLKSPIFTLGLYYLRFRVALRYLLK